jgi:uncharacterized protein (TIGR03083 family)
VTHDGAIDELEIEIERFATALDDADFEAMVPTCPEWTVEDLASHLGLVHQWADHLVRARTTVPIRRAEMDLDVGPVTVEWFRRGATSLVDALRAGDPAIPMWAWGPDQHLAFWSRRQLHETFMHRVDLDVARGATPYVEPVVAADAIDEFLVNLASNDAQIGAIEGGANGEILSIVSTDVPTRWSVQPSESGFRLVEDLLADAELSGHAGALALVVNRRASLVDSAVSISGDRSLVEFWIDHTAFI